MTVGAFGGLAPREVMRDTRRIELQDWTAGGHHLLVSRADPDDADAGRAQLWRVPVEGGQPALVGLPMRGLLGVRAHPDGRRLALSLSAPVQQLWVARGLPR